LVKRQKRSKQHIQLAHVQRKEEEKKHEQESSQEKGKRAILETADSRGRMKIFFMMQDLENGFIHI